MKNSSILLFLFCLPYWVMGQLDNVPINLPKYDQQKLHFGFTLGINSSTFLIDRVGDLKIRDTVYSIEAEAASGLNLGIIGNLRLGEYFDFRFIPTLSFGQRNLIYHIIYNDTSESNSRKKIESSYIEFPIEFKYKSKRRNNYRVYVLAGFKYGIDMVSQAKVKNKEKDIIKLNRKDYGYEIGVGFDFYMTYFKFSPEIKMYNGLKNLLFRENTIYASPLEALYAKTFVVSFTFE